MTPPPPHPVAPFMQPVAQSLAESNGSIQELIDLFESLNADQMAADAAALRVHTLTRLHTAQMQLAQAAHANGLAATAAAAADTQAAKLVQERDAATALYARSWLGGRTWRLFYWFIGLTTAAFVLTFIAEFFLGWNIHPLTWTITAAKALAATLRH